MDPSSSHILITDKPISADRALELVVLPSTGGTALFIGTTRDNFNGKKVIMLEYEAYIPMAVKELEKICKSVLEKWLVKKICIMHRTGKVPIGEASVIIAISSEHRKEPLEAVQYAIDTLKANVPIWKKELYEEGASEWKANKECHWS